MRGAHSIGEVSLLIKENITVIFIVSRVYNFAKFL